MLDLARLITWILITLVAVIGGHRDVAPPCACTTDRYNCGDFTTHNEAQTCFDYCYPDHGDLHHLDRDRDGLACETLP